MRNHGTQYTIEDHGDVYLGGCGIGGGKNYLLYNFGEEEGDFGGKSRTSGWEHISGFYIEF